MDYLYFQVAIIEILLMRNLNTILTILLGCTLLFFLGCGDDEETPVFEFLTETTNATEGSATTVRFNTAIPSGVTPNISLSGTATQGNRLHIYN